MPPRAGRLPRQRRGVRPDLGGLCINDVICRMRAVLRARPHPLSKAAEPLRGAPERKDAALPGKDALQDGTADQPAHRRQQKDEREKVRQKARQDQQHTRNRPQRTLSVRGTPVTGGGTDQRAADHHRHCQPQQCEPEPQKITRHHKESDFRKGPEKKGQQNAQRQAFHVSFTRPQVDLQGGVTYIWEQPQ